MKLAPIAALALAGTTPLPPQETVRFAPEPGERVQLTFEERSTWSLESVLQRVGDASSEVQVPDVEGRAERRLVFVEESRHDDSGEPEWLERRIEVAEGSSSLEIQGGEGIPAASIETELESELVGRTVVFERADGEWTRRFEPEGAADPELLEAVERDAGLAGLLPRGADVGHGDEWEVDAEGLRSLFRAGGELRIDPLGAPDGYLTALPAGDVIAAAMATLRSAAADVEGEALCIWADTREEDGVKLASIEVEIEAQLTRDLTDRVEAALDASGLDGRREAASYRVEANVEGEGVLTWNLTAGRFESFQATLEFDMTLESGWEAGDLDVESISTIVGSVELSAEAAVE